MKMILDLDTGIDDALALSYVLGDPEAEVLGVTCSYGNVQLEQALENTLTVLKRLGRADIPVYAGKRHPLAAASFAPLPMCRVVHGENGIGEVPADTAGMTVQSLTAADFIRQAADQYGHELTLLTAGPLTTLAEVLRADPSFKSKIGRVVMMAGALTVPGNESPFAEANVLVDPEAAEFVFHSGLTLTMVGLDVTLRTLYQEDQISEIRALNTPASEMIAQMMEFYLNYYRRDLRRLPGCPLHDPLAAAAALHPELMETLPLNLKVELEGPGRGRTICDLARLSDPKKDHQVCIGVDADQFLRLYTAGLKRALTRTS